jgi:F-type H+-transporting ATPase subunit a
MRLSPDEPVFWQHGFLKLNGTIVFTWGLMAVLAVGAKLVTRSLSVRFESAQKRSRWQNAVELVVITIEQQAAGVGLLHPEKHIDFLGTLFLFLAAAAVATILPGYVPPTSSLSTTTALAICVFLAVPVLGIREQGLGGYLKTYTEPTFLMAPFNLIGEATRTLALAVRLFGNMMSGAMIVAILLSVMPFIFPILMTVLGLLTGMVQAYIFTILATVYVAAATRPSRPKLAAESSSKPQPKE